MINHIISRFNFALMYIKRSLFNYDEFIDEAQTGAFSHHVNYNPHELKGLHIGAQIQIKLAIASLIMTLDCVSFVYC